MKDSTLCILALSLASILMFGFTYASILAYSCESSSIGDKIYQILQHILPTKGNCVDQPIGIWLLPAGATMFMFIASRPHLKAIRERETRHE